MARKVTQVVPESEPLTTAQTVTIAALLDGLTQRAAAERASVTPETVSRWMNTHAAFVAELNRQRAELWSVTCEKRVCLHIKSLDVLSELLESSDDGTRLRVALAVVKMPATEPREPTEPEDVEISWRANAKQRRLNDMLSY